MIIRLFIALFIFSSFITLNNDDNLIPWKAGKKLTWADFAGKPNHTSGHAALTSSNIGFGWSYGDEGFSYNITCTFNTKESWGKIKNDHILAHEQAHFDITELYARQLHKALKNFKYSAKTGGKDVNALYAGLMNELNQMQVRYDKETDHSRNLAKQKEWLLLVESELKALQAFADYH